MKNKRYPEILVILSLVPALAVLAVSPQSSSGFRVALRDDLALTVTLSLSPPIDVWEQNGLHNYIGNGYAMSLEEISNGDRWEVRIALQRDDGLPFAIEDFRVQCEFSHPDLFALWTYNQVPIDHRNYRALATESFWDLATPNSGIPYALAVTREGNNVLAIGLLSQDRIVNMQGQPTVGGSYQIALDTRLPEHADRFEETVFVDTTPDDWFKTTRQYSDWVDSQRGYEPFPISPACFYPLYDIWYWAYDDTNLGLYWTTLVRAKQLGFGSYLFDAGWESKQGEIFRWLEGTIGNYAHPENKLPGLPGFLRYVQDRLRMNVVLWMSPYAVGRESNNYRVTSRSHVLFDQRNSEFRGGLDTSPMTLGLGRRYRENVNLCPRHSETGGYLKSLFERVSKDYRPNGYWLDFQDTIPFLCESFHGHWTGFGEGFNQSQEMVKRTVLQEVPQATVELRYPVANLNTKPHANLWQSIDSPADFETMRLCSMMMRPFSRGIVMGTDEMYWPSGADQNTVGKFVATTVLSGVPAIGANFEEAPRFHSDIVRAWLEFYKVHQDELTNGEFRPFGNFVHPNHVIESPEAAFIYLRYLEPAPEVKLTGSPTTFYLVNCTDSDNVLTTIHGLPNGDYKLELMNVCLQPVSEKLASLQSGVQISQAVPQGGILKLSRSSHLSSFIQVFEKRRGKSQIPSIRKPDTSIRFPIN
jgi:hypothetical protein